MVGTKEYSERPYRRKDITGQRNGKLVAVSPTGTKTSNGDYKWNFLCDCGGTRVVSLGMFSSKVNLSCKECAAQKVKEERSTHGLSKNNKTYKAWNKIKERCYNKNSIDYQNYGAKGIVMSEDFRNDFVKFYAEVGEAPTKHHSIDRIDHTKGYVTGNMRWATDKQQARNKGKMKNNTSGITGVHWEEKVYPNGKNATTYVVVQWKEYDKNDNKIYRKKSFSVKKLGLLPAFAEAVKFRQAMITKLNEQGYGYTDKHGQ